MLADQVRHPGDRGIALRAGPDAALVFETVDGSDLNSLVVPGLFTYAGFNDFYLSQMAAIVQTVPESFAVLGDLRGAAEHDSDILLRELEGDLELGPAVGDVTFDELGYKGASMREIMRRAGVTLGAVYFHFDNKEALYRAVVDRELGLALATTRAEVAGDPRGGLLSRLFVHSLTALHTRPFLRTLYKEEAASGRRPNDQGALYRSRLPIGADFVRRMRDAGMVRADLDPDALAANLALWNVGLARSAPHENLDALILGMGELVARAADTDAADTTPGKECFARLADDLEALWSRS